MMLMMSHPTKTQKMLKDAQDELAIVRQRYVVLDKNHEQEIPDIVRRSQELRHWIQVLKERLVVLEERKVSTPQEISDEFMNRQEQQPIQLKEVNITPELKVEMFLERIIGTTSEYFGDDIIAINRKGANGPKSVIIGEEVGNVRAISKAADTFRGGTEYTTVTQRKQFIQVH